MSSNTKIKIVGWVLTSIGFLSLLIPPYELRSLVGILWILAGVGILEKNNIARVIVLVFSIMGAILIPLGLLFFLIVLFSITNPELQGQFIGMLIMFVPGFLFDVFVLVVLRNKEVIDEFKRDWV